MLGKPGHLGELCAVAMLALCCAAKQYAPCTHGWPPCKGAERARERLGIVRFCAGVQAGIQQGGALGRAGGLGEVDAQVVRQRVGGVQAQRALQQPRRLRRLRLQRQRAALARLMVRPPALRLSAPGVAAWLHARGRPLHLCPRARSLGAHSDCLHAKAAPSAWLSCCGMAEPLGRRGWRVRTGRCS